MKYKSIMKNEQEPIKNKYHDLKQVDINFPNKLIEKLISNKNKPENYYYKKGHNIKTYLNVFFTKDCKEITPIERIKNLIKIFIKSMTPIKDFYAAKNQVKPKRSTTNIINDTQKKEINETFKETQDEIKTMMENFVDMCTEIKKSEQKNNELITNIENIEKLYEKEIKNFFVKSIYKKNYSTEKIKKNIEQLYEKEIDSFIKNIKYKVVENAKDNSDMKPMLVD